MKNEKNKITEMVFILDRSGSMGGLESDTIGGFNSMLKKQRGEEGEAFVTTVLFDGVVETLHDRLPIGEVPEMTEKEYFVRGCTALLDAIGSTVQHVEKVHKYIRKEDVPGNVVFVITTDGLENASREFTAEKVKAMIEKKKKDGWEFLFIGANIDAVTTAATFGIDESRAVDYRADAKGTRVLYSAVGSAITKMRKCAKISEDWAEEICEDYNSRK